MTDELKQKSLAALERDLDKAFSDYVRAKDHEDGISECYTCDSFAQWQYLDAGHFVDRQHKAARWDLRNVKPQCHNCNRYKDGVAEAFAKRLKKQYGKGIVKELEGLKRKPGPDKLEVIELIEHYKQELKKCD